MWGITHCDREMDILQLATKVAPRAAENIDEPPSQLYAFPMHLPSFPFRLALFIACAVCITANARADNGQADSEKTRADLLKLHNRERRDDGEKPLKLNNKLSEAAQEYADYLAKSGKFSHTAKGTMSSRVKDAGYKPRAVGENIAVGQKSASSVLKSWMHSEGHKRNILSDKYTEVGFGIAKDKKGRLLWVTDFGDR